MLLKYSWGAIIFGLILAAILRVVDGVECPKECTCAWIKAGLSAKCSNINSFSIPDFGDLPIENLDLSNNELMRFPSELSIKTTLVKLDLSNNLIRELERDSLSGFSALRALWLDYNNITAWLDIYPNEVLLPAENLQLLSLVGNHLPDFSTIDYEFDDTHTSLISKSLIKLDLSYCDIANINDRFILHELPKIEELNLSFNLLEEIPRLESTSLKKLVISSCKVTYVSPITFITMPSLVFLDLSNNPNLKFVATANSTELSVSVRRIDLSYCNLEFVDLVNFPYLTSLVLKNNLIRFLSADTFNNNPHIERLDLSHNSIGLISRQTFGSMKQLRALDLSYNIIASIQFDTFQDNKALTTLDLSRNYISSFRSFSAKSLSLLNLSSCEILNIDADAVTYMPNLVTLDLSDNMVAAFPEEFASDTLEILDLSNCRISRINNNSFSYIPRLSQIKLNSNRFTNTFRVGFFRRNRLLYKIWLADNPWACDCNNHDFYDFFTYIMEHPIKINDRENLRCASPEKLYSMLWEDACYDQWFQKHRSMKPAEKVWTIIMSALLILSIMFCGIVGMRKCWYEKKLRRNQRELESNIEHQRNVARYNRAILEQEAQLNAPDPRESNPPCYEDAILMPRLKRTSLSLNDISKKRKKKGRKAFKSEDALDSNARGNYRDAHTQVGDDDELCRLQNYDRSPFRHRRKKLPKGSRYRDRDSWGSLDEMMHFHVPRHSPYLRRDRNAKPQTVQKVDAATEDTLEGASSSLLPVINKRGDEVTDMSDESSEAAGASMQNHINEPRKANSCESTLSGSSGSFDFTSSLEKEILLDTVPNAIIIHSRSRENSL